MPMSMESTLCRSDISTLSCQRDRQLENVEGVFVSKRFVGRKSEVRTAGATGCYGSPYDDVEVVK